MAPDEVGCCVAGPCGLGRCLTGTDYFALVFDEEGPVVPIYPEDRRQSCALLPWSVPLRVLLIHRRCEDWVHYDDAINRAVNDAGRGGARYVSSSYEKPSYTR